MSNEQDLTLQALNQAIQMEIDGKEFYADMSKGSRDEAGKKLFAALSLEEDRHRQKFIAIYQTIQTRQGWPAMPVDSQAHTLSTIFKEATGKSSYTVSELEAVKKAMEMENKTRDFYLERSDKATYQNEKAYYQALAGEERVHHSLLQDYYEYMQNPAQYFTIKEKHSLDGG